MENPSVDSEPQRHGRTAAFDVDAIETPTTMFSYFGRPTSTREVRSSNKRRDAIKRVDRSGPQRWDRKRPSRARLLFYLARWVGAAKCAVRSGGRPTTRASLVYCANRAIMASAQRRDIATVIKVGLQAFETANTALPAT